eukprot:TRINITY_DN5194_c0_g1_i3.p1 TRINITY_DN5194_c0_g1~~TRINITY_DN5194_c0_g1_i3.p1  ORF type:complete len:582 (-),score=128.42 TRINITY_DN5194_c0_g1_i3:599-2344(-)
MENYENLGTIGEGTYGVVMKARHRETGQIVAIKKFKDNEDDDQVRKTALREVRILKQLRNDNVVNLIDVFRRKGKLYLVFEHADHTVLEDLERFPMGLEDFEIKKILYQLIASIEFCHTHNIVHRDVKPENLLITKNGVLKLCDFGFARTLGGPGAKYTDYVATRWYRAPELLVGDTEYSKPVDIWAIGCMVAELKNGAPLFPGESDIDQLRLIMRAFGPLPRCLVEVFEKNPLFKNSAAPTVTSEEIQSIPDRFSWYSPDLMSLLMSCLAYEPSRRATAAELLKHPFFLGFSEWFQQEFKQMVEKDNPGQPVQRKKKPKKPTPEADDVIPEGSQEREGSASRASDRHPRNRESREGRDHREKENAIQPTKYQPHYGPSDLHMDDHRSTLNSRGTTVGDDSFLTHSVSKESLRGNPLRMVALPSLASEIEDPSHEQHQRRKRSDQFPQIGSMTPYMASSKHDQHSQMGQLPNVHEYGGGQADGVSNPQSHLPYSERKKRNQRNGQLQIAEIRQTSKQTKPPKKGTTTSVSNAGFTTTTSHHQGTFPSPALSGMDHYLGLPKSPNIDQVRQSCALSSLFVNQ